MTILDRYVFRSFLEPFLMCLTGFIAIWFIIDLSDNFNDFIEAHATFKQVYGYYLTQVPQTIIMSMPVGLMLALLFCLSRMSRTNEIISQLCVGRSLVRILMPLIVFGAAMTGVCLWLNWEQAPHAEAIKKQAMNQIRRGKKAGEVEPILGHLFRDRLNNRTWYVRKMLPKAAHLEDVDVTQQDAEGHILKKWYAEDFTYDPIRQLWRLDRGMIVNFTPDGDVADSDRFPQAFRIVRDWSETPWRVSSSEFNPSFLGVRELQDYLKFNYDFPAVQLAPYATNLADRYALPLQCLLAVLIAAPLGIVYNRHGAIGGVTAAITLLVLMIMSHHFFVVLGKGMRMDPFVAPWVPVGLLGLVGLVLLYYRSANRDIPTFTDARSRAGLVLFFGLALAGVGAYFLLRHWPESAHLPVLDWKDWKGWKQAWKNVPYDCAAAGAALIIYGFIARLRTLPK